MIRRWNEARGHFEELVDLEPTAQAAGLEELRRQDADLAEVVAQLLEQDREAAASSQFMPQPLGAAPTPADSSERRRIGRFHLRHRLASGRLSSVWAAARVDGAFEQEVAIKLIDTESAAAEAGVEPSAIRGRERHLLASIDSPFVVRLIDAGEVDDATEWIAMEYLDGEPLTSHADRRRLDVRARVQLFVQLCRAVEACHRSDVLHLDLAPANALVTSMGDVKLVDFGSARRANDHPEDRVYAAAPASFTPAYAAPERFANPKGGGARATTVQWDVWSLGAILYELLTSRPPIEIDALPSAEARRRKLGEDAVSPARCVRALPADDAGGVALAREAGTPAALARTLSSGGLGAVALAALRTESTHRTATARELREDLERWLAGEPVVARRETLTQRITRFARRRPRMAVSGAAVALALTTSASLLAFAARRAEAATREVARLEAQEQQRLGVARETSRRLLNDVFQIVSRHAGTQDISRRIVNMGIEVAGSADDGELNLWLADALVKRGATTNDTASWRAGLAHACLRDTARALQLVAPVRAEQPRRLEPARVVWQAHLVSAVAHYDLCNIDRAREEVLGAKAALDSYVANDDDIFSRISWLYAQERARFIENIFEAEYGQYRKVLSNCEAALIIFDEIIADGTHLGVDERSRFHRLRVMEKTLRFLENTEAGVSPGEQVSEYALGFLEEAREDAEVVLALAEAHPTQELLLGRAAEVAERISEWWLRLGRKDEALALMKRALAAVEGPGLERRHSALLVLTKLETFTAEELPEIREDAIGSEAAALLYVRHAQVALSAGDAIEAARLASRSQALLDTNVSSCPERAEHRRARGELEALQGRVEMIGAGSSVGEARTRHLQRAAARFQQSLVLLDSTRGDDLYERSLAPIRAEVAERLAACRTELDR